ncbi:hypothetical protein Tco_0622478 [Tanacetum coccineum]
MAESSNVSFLVAEEGVVNGHVSQLPRERLVSVLHREVGADIKKVSEYRRMSHDHWRSVRRLGVSIAGLRDLGDYGDGDVTLGLLERLRLDNVEKAVRLRLMMKETELKIAEKCSSIKRLGRNGAFRCLWDLRSSSYMYGKTNTPYLKTLKNSRPLSDFEEYAIDTPYMILWSKIKKYTFSANTPYPKTPILCIGQYSVSKKTDMAYWSIRRIQKSDTAYPNSCARILEYFILGAHAKSSNTPY